MYVLVVTLSNQSPPCCPQNHNPLTGNHKGNDDSDGRSIDWRGNEGVTKEDVTDIRKRKKPIPGIGKPVETMRINLK